MGFAADIIEYFLRNPVVFITLFVLYFAVAGTYLYFTTPALGANPFSRDVRKPPQPLVLDKTIRDGVLKQGFAKKRLPPNPDVIIVGSGIGGLAAAVMLARTGRKVLVLEQHDQAGGCCHTYEEKGFEFDVGIHYVGQLRNNTIVKLFLEQMTEGQLQWEDLIDDFDVVALGEPGKQKFYSFNAGGKEVWKKTMLKSFPKEEKALDKFLQLLEETHKNTMGLVMLKVLPRAWAMLLAKTGLYKLYTKYFNYSQRTLQDVLDEITDDSDLKAVLGYSYGDYGTPPDKASFATHSMLLNHYIKGGSYPRGGASEIAFHIIPIIERLGGRVLVRAPVKEILVRDGKATGVVVSKGSEEIVIRAPLVISGAGITNTLMTLLPKEVAQKTYQFKHLQSGNLHPGVGAMSIFVGLNGTTEELKLKPQNIWAFTSNNMTKVFDEYLRLPADEVLQQDIPILFISFPSSKDSTYNQRFPGKSVCTIVTLASWTWYKQWEKSTHNRRDGEYEAFKNEVGRRAWEQTLEIFPQLRDKVEYFEVGSPITNQYYLNSSKGEIYGLDHSYTRFANPEIVTDLRPETGIKGLYFTGQDVFNCGFVGAAFGGLLCAGQILGRNLFQDLTNLKNDLKVQSNKKKD